MNLINSNIINNVVSNNDNVRRALLKSITQTMEKGEGENSVQQKGTNLTV